MNNQMNQKIAEIAERAGYNKEIYALIHQGIEDIAEKILEEVFVSMKKSEEEHWKEASTWSANISTDGHIRELKKHFNLIT